MTVGEGEERRARFFENPLRQHAVVTIHRERLW